VVNCDRCHDKLQAHGNLRNQTVACVVCHNPAATDVARRPVSESPPESIAFKILVHKNHTGEDLANEYTVYGFGGAIHDFKKVRFPGDRRDCVKCHVDTTYTVPLPLTEIAVITPRNYWTPTLPTAAACLACHDDLYSAAHAFVNTAPFGEACPVCHQESAFFAVSKIHAR
jgi:OmcA/MtrC family decaheme c-type cytochrome